MPADELPRLKDLAATVGVPSARRHIFLCADQTNPKCCDRDRSIEAWEFLKKRLKQLGLSEAGGHPPHEGQLSSHLRRRSHCRRLSGRDVVSRLRSASARADHRGASDRRAARRRLCDRYKRSKSSFPITGFQPISWYCATPDWKNGSLSRTASSAPRIIVCHAQQQHPAEPGVHRAGRDEHALLFQPAQIRAMRVLVHEHFFERLAVTNDRQGVHQCPPTNALRPDHRTDAGQCERKLAKRRRVDSAAMQIGNEIGHRDIQETWRRRRRAHIG